MSKINTKIQDWKIVDLKWMNIRLSFQIYKNKQLSVSLNYCSWFYRISLPDILFSKQEFYTRTKNSRPLHPISLTTYVSEPNAKHVLTNIKSRYQPRLQLKLSCTRHVRSWRNITWSSHLLVLNDKKSSTSMPCRSPAKQGNMVTSSRHVRDVSV